MATVRESIDMFTKAIDELISSTYVLALSKTANLLRIISSSRLFYELFSYCTENFDYEQTANSSFIFNGELARGEYIPPREAKDVIALTISLMYQLDMNEVDLLNILENYFYVGDPNESFRNFTQSMLVPFKTEVLRVANAMAGNVVQDKPTAKPVYEQVPQGKTISSDCAEKLKDCLAKVKKTIFQAKIPEDYKSEVATLYDNFEKAIELGDVEAVKLAYYGYKYVTLYYRSADPNVWKIETILKREGLFR